MNCANHTSTDNVGKKKKPKQQLTDQLSTRPCPDCKHLLQSQRDRCKWHDHLEGWCHTLRRRCKDYWHTRHQGGTTNLWWNKEPKAIRKN